MSISARVSSYLVQHHIPYQVYPHFHSVNSISSAISANVPLDHIAKAVILKDHQDRFMMAVLPGNNKINLSVINNELMGSYQLLQEDELYKLFNDCENGAVPPIAQAYNMGMVCDNSLDELEDVYLEAGDHERLICINKQSFEKLTANAKHIRFSQQMIH
jgi:Ala-tRNA(Pro) deacylase